MDFGPQVLLVGLVIVAILVIGVISFLMKFIVKAEQGKSLIKNSIWGTEVSFTATTVLPILHRLEVMDISVKRVEIERVGKDGLICKDNIRADIKVAFFVRVNKTGEDVKKVAQSLGCVRASDPRALVELFDAKFSEALKTVGKRFDFTQLYTDRSEFKAEILQIIGTDLNGYILDDAAIDYLEQTPLTYMNAQNILDAEGIKKITELTATQTILANKIDRDREKTITKQNVEAREAILEMERQLAETQERQRREVLTNKAREEAETQKVQQEERLKSERARITAEEEIRIAEEQKERQVIVAQKSKERTDQVETERVAKDRELEATERERIVSLARIEKDKAIEQERKLIQDVIRERVIVEKAVVQEEEKIKDTRTQAEADRKKLVKVVEAEATAQEAMIKQVKAAEAGRTAAEQEARQKLVEAEAEQGAAEKRAVAMKTLAEARSAEEAVTGMAEIAVMKARAIAVKEQGAAEASVMEMKAAAHQKEGEAEAYVLAKKFSAEAEGIEQKADAMRKLDGVGKEHEEFKLELEKEKAVELAQIAIQKDIAASQAAVLAEALKVAKIEIVGGESMFFDQLVNAITRGKAVDQMVGKSKVLTEVKETFFGGNGEEFQAELQRLTGYFGLKSEDVKNLSIAALIGEMMGAADTTELKATLGGLLKAAKKAGMAGKPASILDLK